jgi:o-succinylbenzoate---CoA ligase
MKTDFLSRAAERSPDAHAVVGVPGKPGAEAPIWTWSELDAWVDRVATALTAAGLDPGERVAMRLPPCPEAVVLLHAVPRAGGTIVPVHAGWTESETARAIIAVGRPSIIITTMGEVVEWDGEAPPPRSGPGAAWPGIRPDVPAAIVLTSGTSGSPRPVPLSHRNLAMSATGVAERLQLQPEDCWLTSLSPAHVGGLALLHRAAVVGCAVLTRPRFDAGEAAELIDSGMVSHASLVPVMLQRLIEARGMNPPPSSLRCLLVGGAGTPAPLLKRALDLGYPIALTYGLTEASSQVATASPEQVREKPGSVGRSIASVELRIEGPDSQGVGEILVRGPTVVSGAPREDSSTSRQPGPSVFLDGERWLHTGDLGRLDADGDLWVAGRRSERIVSAGVTIEPAEVEEILLRHPSVREVAVVGEEDPEWGERVVAVVVPEESGPPPTLDDLLAFARERLASAKRPRALRLLDELPRNAAGKVDRKALAGGSRPASGNSEP